MFIECSTKEKYSVLKNLHDQLFVTNQTEEQQESEKTTTIAVFNNLSLKERLFEKINECKKTDEVVLISNYRSCIRKELGLFEKK